MKTTAVLISSVVLVAGLLTGCGGSSSPAPASVAAQNIPPAITAPAPDIVISNFTYTVRGPLKPGQQVTIVDDDQASHSAAADTSDAFDVRVSGGGGVGTFTAPTAPGTYEFHCKYHANMHGSLTVQ